MTFSSVPFMFYFLPIVFILYYIFFFSLPIKNFILLIFSLIFYTWGEPKYIFLLMLSILVNYLFGLGIDLLKTKKKLALSIVVLSLIFNLGILFVFKYLTFISSNLNIATQGKIEIINIALPIGISFFTFQAISYVIDIYRQDVAAQKNILKFALYLSFFPKLIQGPITKYKDFAPQIENRTETWQKFSSGSCLFITGLGKKVLLANNMAVVTDRIFEIQKMGNIPVSLAWLGALAYTFQIYFDFSGYSDMAIGLGLMFGFKIERNFNYPYISKSIREFWGRWHMSLGRWFKDYLYIPLGGSRVLNKDLIIRNLAVVWMATGIWHGANWTFLFWGILNFVFIAAERIFEFENSKLPNAIKHAYAMFVIIIGWVIFRSDSLQQAGNYLVSMFNFPQNGFLSDYTYMFIKEYGIFFLFAILFSMPIAGKINQLMAKGIVLRRQVSKSQPDQERVLYGEAPFTKLITFLYPIAMILLFLVCTTYIVKGSYNPFIYFQF
ncbi:MBOAT family O-acyltransferase [Scatolibacter rhodanostii]|uniref:MBOAT family O-acyltransferase n=1 Tax=Scatolibacter rhodanostii TaxID=2014781 RepID=UPI000C08CF3A|nr:MBOAT family O-acyltransferase [Scatolibacter rhodanostii]